MSVPRRERKEEERFLRFSPRLDNESGESRAESCGAGQLKVSVIIGSVYGPADNGRRGISRPRGDN